MEKNLTYRKCGLNDLEILTAISRETFVEAYEKDNNPDDFKTYIDSAFSSNQIESELLNPNSEFYFIYLNKTLVGYFKLNEKDAQGEDYGNQSLELSRIYLLKEFQGQDIGRLTLLKIIALANEKDKSWLWLSVWQLNVNAVRFYERHGFVKYDTQVFHVGNDPQMDWLMRLDLD
ncbi:MAG: GNAT family N-acetyltransferase [Gelidibacter sp.]